MTNTPISRFRSTRSLAAGIVTQIMKDGISTSRGATQKMALSAQEGIRSSFNTSFTASAAGWMRPKGPVRVGPRRRCRRPRNFRSIQIIDITIIERAVNRISRAIMSSRKSSRFTGPPRQGRCPGNPE